MPTHAALLALLAVLTAQSSLAAPTVAAAADSVGSKGALHTAAASKMAQMQAAIKQAPLPAHPHNVAEVHPSASKAKAPVAKAPTPAERQNGPTSASHSGGADGGMGGLGALSGMGGMSAMMPGMNMMTGSGSGKGGNSGGTYGVMKSVGDQLGLTGLTNKKNKGAKPVGKAILADLKAKHPQAAWGNALTIVGCIGGTVITLTAIGTYFVAKAENKRLKKAKKSSNLLGGRYGTAKNEADSDDEQEKPVYEPMTMRDMV
mmetsp:Transcript_27199/g.68524  ORF Transcript_27199/g.68524 Transcript_27199/m.68524 type:complete len:260 (+) Transcript_27199:155-934(+)